VIIDCHTHLNNYHDEGVSDLEAAIERLELQMRRCRVDYALVLTSYKVTPGRPATRTVVEAIRDRKNLFAVAGLSHASFQKQDLDELADYVAAGHVRGLKIYPGYEPFFPSDPKLEPAFAFALEHGIPLMIHSGDTYTPRGKIKYSHPLHVDELAVDHPGLKIVICHIGNPWIRDCMEVVYKNADVYTDFSGLVLGNFDDRFEQYMRKQVQEMLLYGVQPEKCLYGTDWPISSMESYLEFIEELKMPRKDKQKILYQNAIRLFRLPIQEPSPGPFGMF
jgi:uncharacterized protein